MFDENRSSIGQRVHVLGNSSSGKSTVGLRLSRAPGVPFVELDALNWEPGCLTSTARYKREDDIPLGRLRGSPPGPGGVASHVLTVCRGLRP
jgi:hypothetical protein